MSRSPEQRVVDSAVEALDRVSDATGVATEQALSAARRQALDGLRAGRPSNWMWAGATAVALALVIGISLVDRNGGNGALLARQLAAEPELYQEMEFYLWLSEELENE